MKSNPCKYCGGATHTSLMCFHKPRNRIRKESPKAYAHRQETKSAWLLENPADDNGEWECYLQISDVCPIKLNADTLVLEHVKSRSTSPELRYVISNIKASCEFCNRLKGSKSLELLAEYYPKLNKYLGGSDVHSNRVGRRRA